MNLTNARVWISAFLIGLGLVGGVGGGLIAWGLGLPFYKGVLVAMGVSFAAQTKIQVN